MTTTTPAQADEKARELVKAAIRRGCADEINGKPAGDILIKGCTAAEYIHPEDAAETFVDCIADEVLAALRPEGEAVAWRFRLKDGAIWTLRDTPPENTTGQFIVQPLYATPPAPAQVEAASLPVDWQPIETVPDDGEKMEVKNALGAILTSYANPEAVSHHKKHFVSWRRAASLPAPGGVVRVKALEWKRHPEDGSLVREGQGAQRDYVERATQPWGAYFLMVKGGRYSIKSSINPFSDAPEFETPAEAKAAAQADYESRIRAALATDASPSGER